ncbi:MAG: hypothetical protein ACRDX9_01915 [Acidimicrobiia bacterium]
MFSYFPYAAAFIDSASQEVTVDPALVGIALLIAPFVFVVVGLVSRNPGAPKRILISMGLLIALGLSLGLISPVLGASAGFGVGVALCLRLPDVPDQMRRRLVAVTLAVVYTMVLLFVAPPAGVLTGALVPTLLVGFADEYGAWRWAKRQGEAQVDGNGA